MSRVIRESFLNARERFRECVEGTLYGIIVGESLGRPFRNVPIGGKLKCHGREVEFVDRVYATLGVGNEWPPGAYFALEACGLLMDLYNRKGSLKLILQSRRVTEVFQGRPSHQCLEDLQLKPVTPAPWAALLSRAAPIGIFSGRCRLTKEAAVKTAIRVFGLTEKDPLVLFPAVELVLALRSIFLGQSLVPDTFDQIASWVKDERVKAHDARAAFELYKEKRFLPLEELDPTSCLWTWRHVTESIIGLLPGNPWKEITSF